MVSLSNNKSDRLFRHYPYLFPNIPPMVKKSFLLFASKKRRLMLFLKEWFKISKMIFDHKTITYQL